MYIPQDPALELAGVFARLSGVLLTEQTVDSALELITSLTTDSIADSAGAGISLMSTDGDRLSSAATDPIVERLDGLQYDLDEGPCLEAWRERTVVSAGDLSSESRWTAWSQRATDLGFLSVLSAPVFITDRDLGAMKVYSRARDAYDDTSVEFLRRFAAQAAILLANVHTAQAGVELSSRLRESLHGRDVIAMARGILMARKGFDHERAQRHLLGIAHRARLPVRLTAERIVESPSGRLDPG